jgi:uncharacterized tellurite resistance protein B-like protein
MLDTLRSFLVELTGGAVPQDRFQDSDYRVAAAALLVHVTGIDGEVSPEERRKLHSVLKYRFELTDAETDELVDLASRAEGDAVDMYQFTSLLNRSLDEEGRCRIIEMMWEIIYADGHASEFEDNVVWRVADLLHVSSRERIALRGVIAGRLESEPDQEVTAAAGASAASDDARPGSAAGRNAASVDGASQPSLASDPGAFGVSNQAPSGKQD